MFLLLSTGHFVKRQCRCLTQADPGLESSLPLSLKLSQTFPRQPAVHFRPRLSGGTNGSEKTSVDQDYPPASFKCLNNIQEVKIHFPPFTYSHLRDSKDARNQHMKNCRHLAKLNLHKNLRTCMVSENF